MGSNSTPSCRRNISQAIQAAIRGLMVLSFCIGARIGTGDTRVGRECREAHNGNARVVHSNYARFRRSLFSEYSLEMSTLVA